MTVTPGTTIRLTKEDRLLLEQLKQRFGLTSNTQVIRIALRMLAEQPVSSVVGTTLPKTEEDRRRPLNTA